MLIAHDLGTTGNKASLHAADGRIVATTTASYPTRYAADTASEQDPHDWWRAVVRATRELLEVTATPAESVAGLCISGQMMGLVLLDGAGEPVRPAMIWSDQRASAEAEELAERFGAEAAYRITGNRIAAPYTLPKLMWVRTHDPEAYARGTALCMAKDYVNLRLTGLLVTDRSDASHTGAYDLNSGEWSLELLAAAAVDPGLWPEVVESTDVLGTLTDAAATELGLLPQTRVVVGGGDGPMAAVAAGCVAPDSPGYVCLGTSAWYACATTAPVLDTEQRSFTLGHVVPGLFTPTATTQTGAGSVRWAAEALRGDAAVDVGELIGEAMQAVAADEGLFFLPYLIGERSPWWDAHASGTFLGLRMHHRRPHLARAVLEGVGYSLALCMAPLRGDAAERPIDVIGGGAASDSWLALLADIWGVPVRRRSVTGQANSLGAAITGLVGLGWADFSIAPTLSSVEAEFFPGAESSAHRAHLARFADAYRALRPWFAGEGT